MTGLSRKFAIPLLELLDEMGVTKRQRPRPRDPSGALIGRGGFTDHSHL